jgi:large subunit ribosomal protein L31
MPYMDLDQVAGYDYRYGIPPGKIIWKKRLIWLNFAAHFKNCTAKSVHINYRIMKKGLHPENYRFVVFKDMSNGYSFLSRSSAPTRETVKWEDGNEYPLIKLEISNTSHPFFTGQKMLVDTAGRIDKFKKRYEKK